MTTDTPASAHAHAPAWRQRLFTGLLVWMVISFTLGALTKYYWGETFFGPPYEVKFEDWGYPAWFRFLVGTGELVGAALLVTRRRRFLGAVLLAVITAGATITHLANPDPVSQEISAPLHLMLSLIVAWVARPAGWREFRRMLQLGRRPMVDQSAGRRKR